jgi:uncharacterized protein YqeY
VYIVQRAAYGVQSARTELKWWRMALLDRIQSDMVAAMKAKEEARLGAIRLIKTALKKHEIDAMKPLDENTELQVLSTLIKQRRESADMFRKGNRLDLADKEEAELKLIESYMPAAPSEEEIEAAIAAALAETGVTSAKQMGVVMKAAQAKLAGKRVDGKALSDKVRARLG